MTECTLMQRTNKWEMDEKYKKLFPNEASMDLAKKLNIKEHNTILVVSVGMLDVIGYNEFPSTVTDKEILKEVLLNNAINYFIVHNTNRTFENLQECHAIPLVDVLKV